MKKMIYGIVVLQMILITACVDQKAKDDKKESKSHGDLEDDFKKLKSKHEMVNDLKSKTMIAKQKAKIAKLKAERAVLKSNLQEEEKNMQTDDIKDQNLDEDKPISTAEIKLG